ncbi:SRPBCC family protein [Achromobacter insuavis]
MHLAARFVTETPANWKSIVDNYMECYHCAPAHPGFSDSVDVGQYTHTMHGNWSLQFGKAKSSPKSFQFDESIKDPSFSGFWAWPCTMFNAPPGGNFMTVIYEFPASAGITLQHYDIYFLNKELTEEQKSLIEWYRDVFRPKTCAWWRACRRAEIPRLPRPGPHHGRPRTQRTKRARHCALSPSGGPGAPGPYLTRPCVRPRRTRAPSPFRPGSP